MLPEVSDSDYRPAAQDEAGDIQVREQKSGWSIISVELVFTAMDHPGEVKIMGFEKFGAVSFTSQKSGGFCSYGKRKLREQVQLLRALLFPPRADCSWCMTKNVSVKSRQGALSVYQG